MDKDELLNELKKSYKAGLISKDEFNKEIFDLEYEEAAPNDVNPGKADHTASTGKHPLAVKGRLWYLLLVVAVVVFVGAYKLTNGFKPFENKQGDTAAKPFVNVYFDAEEVFPVYLLYLKNVKKGLLEVTITNPENKPCNLELEYGFTELGALANRKVIVQPNSVIKMPINPYSGKMMGIFAPLNATFVIQVTEDRHADIFSKSWSLKINPCDEIPWKIKNQDYSRLIACWVTPNNAAIKQLMVKAKNGDNFAPAGNMDDAGFKKLVKAIFNTVRTERIAYINGTISFGEGYSQRIRLPELTLKTKLANSIDGSVLLASLFENAGLRPSIIILPEHALVGVSRPNQKNDMIFIETTLLGRSTIESILSFESTYATSIKKGKEEYNDAYSKFVSKESGRFAVIDIHKARQEGVFPIN